MTSFSGAELTNKVIAFLASILTCDIETTNIQIDLRIKSNCSKAPWILKCKRIIRSELK
jgi:hypothetical protein